MSDSSSTTQEDMARRRKELFGDCALVEIIHLHECLRGALKALQSDVTALSHCILQDEAKQKVADLERRVAGRFKVIWSVFRAHSAAEDEFIWPALRSKTMSVVEPHTIPPEVEVYPQEDGSVDQEEYEEDHADEERMFRRMDELLSQLHNGLLLNQDSSVQEMVKAINDLALSLSKHLYAHLEKEEMQCMPLVVRHLTKAEITDLVGQIMGKRSSDTIGQIMTMAVQNLNEADRTEMVKYMKQAMVGTFFEKWLAMSGWMSSENPPPEKEEEDNDRKVAAKAPPQDNEEEDKKMGKVVAAKRSLNSEDGDVPEKRFKTTTTNEEQATAQVCFGNPERCATCESSGFCLAGQARTGDGITSQAELEKLIRAIASNPALGPVEKQTTIQGLRDSVFKSNLRHRDVAINSSAEGVASAPISWNMTLGDSAATSPPLSVTPGTRSRRTTPAPSYFKKNADGKVELVWSSESASKFPPDDKSVPLFSAAELAPTYHDGANGAVLGCPHYARACKLRHPSSGRLYTCRLCCEQEREMPMKDKDSPLDRYAVTEVLCMRCGALQPASERCVNPKCDSTRPFAKYSCNICNLYDDDPSHSVYHCAFCNVCRLGAGLGIDYRHCMRCNACVSLADDDHQCVPQKLQGTCPICHDSMFESTEPLRGLKCGHVMHMSCYNLYVRGQNYTCPLCKKSMDDMTEYFALLDAAVRMQPMPAAYTSTSNIYCQDCNETGQTQYHFVGCKCPHCGSYNTRELGRVQNQQGP